MAPPDINVTGEDHFAVIEVMVNDAMGAERESHFHELYSELFGHQCRFSSKTDIMLSVAPQQEVGNQSFDSDSDDEDTERVTRSQKDKKAQFVFEALKKPDSGSSSDESLAHYTDGRSSEVEKSTEEDSDREVKNSNGKRVGTKGQQGPKSKRRRGHYEIWTPPTHWLRPDFLIFARFKNPSGAVNKKVLLILELKMDSDAFNLERDIVSRNKLTLRLPNVVAQVLAQAQYLFAEHKDQDSIHAMIAVGFFFVDFKIKRSSIPTLKQGCLYDSARGKATLDATTIYEMAGVTDDVNCILTGNRDDLSKAFLTAWENACAPYEELRDHD